MCHSDRGVNKNRRNIVYCKIQEDIRSWCSISCCSVPHDEWGMWFCGKLGKKSVQHSVWRLHFLLNNTYRRKKTWGTFKKGQVSPFPSTLTKWLDWEEAWSSQGKTSFPLKLATKCKCILIQKYIQMRILYSFFLIAPSEAISSPPTHPTFLVKVVYSKMSVILVRTGCIGKSCYLDCWNYLLLS